MFDTKDILVYENGNGGEISVLNNDIELAEQLYQQAYLCLFGGNVLASTRGDEIAGELRNDWWGNSLFFSDVAVKQFNSETEKALSENALNSTGRLNILRAVENDLSALKSVADVAVSVQLTAVNEVIINIKLTQPQNQQGASLQLIWDNAKKELIINKKI
jgi:hypothetical protein